MIRDNELTIFFSDVTYKILAKLTISISGRNIGLFLLYVFKTFNMAAHFRLLSLIQPSERQFCTTLYPKKNAHFAIISYFYLQIVLAWNEGLNQTRISNFKIWTPVGSGKREVNAFITLIFLIK